MLFARTPIPPSIHLVLSSAHLFPALPPQNSCIDPLHDKRHRGFPQTLEGFWRLLVMELHAAGLLLDDLVVDRCGPCSRFFPFTSLAASQQHSLL